MRVGREDRRVGARQHQVRLVGTSPDVHLTGLMLFMGVVRADRKRAGSQQLASILQEPLQSSLLLLIC